MLSPGGPVRRTMRLAPELPLVVAQVVLEFDVRMVEMRTTISVSGSIVALAA